MASRADLKHWLCVDISGIAYRSSRPVILIRHVILRSAITPHHHNPRRHGERRLVVIKLRPAEPDDATGIARVHVDTWRDTYAGMIPDGTLLHLSPIREAAHWRQTISLDPGERVVVAVSDTHGVVGFGSCGRFRGENLPYRGEIYTLYVHPDAQGRGVGRGLLTTLFATLTKRGLWSVLIWVLACNPARFFYQAMGGKWIAARDEKLFGTVLHEMGYGWRDVRLDNAPEVKPRY